MSSTKAAKATAGRSASTSASSTRPQPKVTRAKRTAAPATVNMDIATDNLAADLDRVLRVTQPQPRTTTTRKGPPTTSRTPAPAPLKNAPSTGVTTNTTTTGSRATSRAKAPVSSTQPATTSRRATTSKAVSDTATKAPSRTRATASSATTSRTKAAAPPAAAVTEQPAPPAAPAFPWSNAGAMSSRDRAQAAQAASNGALVALTEAAQKGYKHSSPEKASDTQEKVGEAVRAGLAGVTVLRELYGGVKATPQRLAVEKGAFALVFRCVAMEMFETALEMMELAKPHMLRLYAHDAEAGPTSSEVQSAPNGSKAAGNVVKAAWRSLAVFPPPHSPSDLDEPTRTLICNYALAAWTSLVALDSHAACAILSIPTDISTDPLNPFSLAPTLSVTTVGPLGVHLYRRIAAIQNSSMTPEWLHLRFMAIFAVAISASTSQGPATNNSPEHIWSSAGRSVKRFLAEMSDDGGRRHAAEFIGRVVELVERIGSMRGEARESWFGPTSSSVVDIWVGLGRNLGDSSIIDSALAVMAAGTSIAGPPGLIPSTTPSPSSSRLATPISSASSSPIKASRKSPKSAASGDAVVRVGLANAQLTKTLVVVDGISKSESPSSAKLAEALDAITLKSLTASICDLDGSEPSLTACTAVVRSIERIRRLLVRLVEKPALAPASRLWLVEAVGFSEGVLTPQLRPRIAREVLPGAVDTAVHLTRLWDASGKLGVVTNILDRVYSLCETSQEHLPAGTSLNLFACLAQSAHNAALRLTRINKMADAAQLAQRSCDWTVALLAHPPEQFQSEAEEKTWRSADINASKRFELLAFCLQSGDKQAALRAYVLSLVNLDKTTLGAVAAGSNTTPLAAVFAGLPDLSNTVKRLAALIVGDDVNLDDLAVLLATEMEARQLMPEVQGAMVEYLVESIEHAQFRPTVQAVTVSMCDLLLAIYDSTAYLVRRMRSILRYMSLISSTGIVPERFNGLGEEMEQLGTQEVLGNDIILAKYRDEYRICALIHRTLNAYHSESASVARIAELGNAALNSLRAIVLPPIPSDKFPAAVGKRPVSGRATRSASGTARPGRAAASKAAPASGPSKKSAGAPRTAAAAKAAPPMLVADDMPQVVLLLNALASLFGILGLSLPKLETLKVTRAVLRNCPDMVDAYAQTTARLASKYGRLGKHSRAAHFFAQATKLTNSAEHEHGVSVATQTELHLRHSRALALRGQVKQAKVEFAEAAALAESIAAPSKQGTYASRWIQLCAVSERVAMAHVALSAIKMAEGNATAAIASLTIAYRQWCRAAHGVAHFTPDAPAPQDDSSSESQTTPQDSKSQTTPQDSKSKQPFALEGKQLGGLQWYYAEALFDATFELSAALAKRGSVKECEYYVLQARGMATSLKSSIFPARAAVKSAALEGRKRRFDVAAEELERAVEALDVTDGPDAVDVKRVHGELLNRQQEVADADEAFISAVESISGLDAEYTSSEARIPSSRKESMAPAASSKEPVLPAELDQVLLHRAWLLREAGCIDEYEEVIQQLDIVPETPGAKAERLFLESRVAMHEAFSHFKTDLFMSSLTESTIAMTMGAPEEDSNDRQSNRNDALVMLERAAQLFRSTLRSIAPAGPVEEVRQTCISLALLGAFQTSLGHGSPTITSSVADMLASITSLSLHRELVAAIDSKFSKPDTDDFDWPRLDVAEGVTQADAQGEDGEAALKRYWDDVRDRHTQADILQAPLSLESLPPTWAVVSIAVTDDRNTMLVSRHQNGHQPVVFCIPLDRQGKREGEDEAELFTFDAGIEEMNAIMAGNEANIKSIKDRKTLDDRKAWWRERLALDTRLGELLATIEFCWLGAFKTALNPRRTLDPKAFAAFRERLDHIFQTALGSAGSDVRRGARVCLNEELLQCFASLSSKCRPEEIEDLVYFVLDLYQFNGIAVALAELDFDQLGVDVKGALADLEKATNVDGNPPHSDEHLLLALDKNVQGIPWESIPILRGRPVSRIPSLPFVLDQVALGRHLGTPNGRISFDASRTRYFLNPSGDLSATQGRFEERLTALEGAGWGGIKGRIPTEAEMASALGESDLVMYFGHGGAEEYIRSYKVRALRRCAVTMLWGCSSGLLREQGDFERTGTPMDYALGGSPCLVANLWDVTDKDIDKVTEVVMDALGLSAAHLPRAGERGVSVVQAVNAARASAKLQYLTGAAPVVYGLPVYAA